jgi:nicotinate phosphoribosyltransferase
VEGRRLEVGEAEPIGVGALLVDLYQLTMAQSYFAEGIHERPATFSLYCRTLPSGWGYLVAAGLDDALGYLETLSFEDADLAFLEETRLFTADFLSFLGGLRFGGDVRALREGTVFFPDEPVLELTGRIIEAQLVETVVLNEIHFQSLVAGKAARCVDAARGRTLVDFSLRRTHRGDAGMRVARSSYLAGFDSTSNVAAGKAYGMPIAGTMAHSYVESFDDELAAFRAYARAYPDRCILLIDTYDTLQGARRAVAVARELAERGHRLQGVRLDSGDLAELSRRVRAILDEAGFVDAIVFASGGLDEHEVARLVGEGAPVDGFGIGSKLGTSADSPFLDMAYKLVVFDGRPTMKFSAEKTTLPGAKEVWRVARGGSFVGDVLGREVDRPPDGAEPLLQPVMQGGRRILSETLEEARRRCSEQRSRLPEPHRSLEAEPYPVELSAPLSELRESVAAELRRRQAI